jgi:hypothetical protein
VKPAPLSSCCFKTKKERKKRKEKTEEAKQFYGAFQMIEASHY